MAGSWLGRWELEIQDASLSGLLNSLAEGGVSVYRVVPLDAVTVQLEVAGDSIHNVRRLLKRRGSVLLSCGERGMRAHMLRVLRRKMLVISLVLCVFVLGISNLFIWRVEVHGGESIPTGTVLRAAERSGMGIGSFWPGMDRVQAKHLMLLELDEVQWLGLNCRAGVLHINLRERKEKPAVIDNDTPIHITAVRDGIIKEISAKQGQCVVGTGDVVEQGQVLITGAVKSSIGTTRPAHALGMVKAHTFHTISAIQACSETGKRYTDKKKTKFAVIFGSKRINFYLGSSISDRTCDKIIMDYHLCMDGVFALPVTLVVERYVLREPVVRELTVQEQTRRAEHTLMETLERRLSDDGTVVHADFASAVRESGMTVTLAAECLEEIGEETPISETELQQIQLDNTLGDETTND